MSRARPRSADLARLERLIRESRVMDPGLKRHWLQVLPFLTPADRQRLAAILRSGESPSNSERPG